MAKILSIEIGNLITRVAEMDFKVKNPKVYHYFSMPTPKGVVEDGFVHESPEFIADLKAALAQNKIKTKSVIFVVSSSKIVTREVAVPAIKENQLSSYIQANANDYFPIDLTVYEIAHVLLGKDIGEDGKEKYRVMVMAAGKDLISGYATLASTCGLKLNSIEYIGNSVYQIMRSEFDNEATLVVRIEDNVTIASVISNGNMILQRTLAYGVERAVKAVIDSTEYYESDYESALKLLSQKPCLKVALSDRTRVFEKDEASFEGEKMEEARATVTSTFTQLIGNLVRVIELYNSKEPLNAIKKVVLIGIGSEIVNLPKLFRNEIGLETVVMNRFNAINLSALLDDSVSRYAGVFGAALNPVGLTSDIKKEKKSINYGLYTVVVLLVAIAALAGLFLKAFMPYQDAQKEEVRLKGLEAKYKEAENVHNQYLAVQDLYDQVNSRVASTEHNNDNLLLFLSELEEKLPSDINLLTLSSNNAEVTFSMHVMDYSEAAKIVQILRGFESLRTVSISGLGTVAEDGSGLDIGISCTYFTAQ